MRLYRSAPGSHPAPVPRCRGGAARWKGVRPCRVPYPCRRVHRVPARQRKALSGRLRATDSERARGGGSRTRARASLFGFRGMTGSRPAQRTVWINPALWSATNQGNFFFFWAGAWGRRRHPSWAKGGTGAFPHSGKSPRGCCRERREKGRGEGRARAVKLGRYGIRRQAGMPHQAWRKRYLPCLTCTGRYHAGRGSPRPCAAPKPHKVSACPGPTDYGMFATMGERAVVCRKICPDKARWEGEGV